MGDMECDLTTLYYMVPSAHQSPPPNDVSVGSPDFAGLKVVTDRLTD